MKISTPNEVEERELVTLALNEQGYLFQHKIATILQSKSGPFSHDWQLEASELPVSLPNGDETRIDLILRHGPETGVNWRLLLECKRSTPEYKRWVFFASHEISPGPSPKQYYVEQADLNNIWNHQGLPPVLYRLAKHPASSDCPVFDFGVESKTERPGSGKKASATKAIEEAFQQVSLGQAGLALRVRKACTMNFRFLPAVVTTAELMCANFDSEAVSTDRGMVVADDIKLEPRKWLAVNYRISDVVSQFSEISTYRMATLAQDLEARQVRTVFVVQAAHIQEFLKWVQDMFPARDDRR